MTYTAISDFKYGLDRRRPQSSGVPGTLWLLKNGVITRGGDIERTKKFVATYELPAGATVGFASVRGLRYVFGHDVEPEDMPAGVRYTQLEPPDPSPMTELLDARGIAGKVYAIAAYEDGNIYHFYDGVRVGDWDTIADDAFDYTTVAARLAALIDAGSACKAEAFGATVEITANVAGQAFTISAAGQDVDGSASDPTAEVTIVQPNVAAVDEVNATATITVTGGGADSGVSSVSVDGTPLLGGEIVDWVGSNADTANALAVEINNNTTTHGYTASADGAVVTISAPAGDGVGANGRVVAVTDFGTFSSTVANFAGGVSAVDPIAQVATVAISAGTEDSSDAWLIVVDGVTYKTTGLASATGTTAFVNKSRVYSTAGSLIRYSKINDPSDWTDSSESSGAGFINVSSEVDGVDVLTGMAAYSDLVAVFAKNAIVTYTLAADSLDNALVQPIGNTGTVAHRSIVAYGANDVYYLDETGVRSLRTREAYNSAYASDVGSAIDPFVHDLVLEVGAAQVAKASAAIEAVDGRYMLAIGRYIIVLSQFPSSKIVAWSYIDFGAQIDAMVRVGRDVYLRSGDTIYAYGGVNGETYPDADESTVEVLTPFISAKDPAGGKTLEGFDMAAENEWRIQVLTNPNDPTKYVDAGVIAGVTYNGPSVKIPGETSHYAVRATCRAAGYASLSSIAVHSSKAEQQ